VKVCPHANAEPVITLDGETVAAICPDCDAKLSPKFIGCPHEYTEEITAYDDPDWTFVCLNCFAELPSVTPVDNSVSADQSP
jgi:hypothetical protein